MTSGIILLFFGNLVSGAILPMFIKLGVGQIPPITFTVFRFAIAFLIILPFYLKQRGFRLVKQNGRLLLLNSAFFTINVGLYSIGIQYTNVIISQILYAFVPVIVAFVGHFWLKEKITKHEVIGSAIAFSGLLFLLFQSVNGSEITFGHPLGNMIIMTAVVSWSFYFVLSRKLAETQSQVSISSTNFFTSLVILSMLLPVEQTIRPFTTSSISSLGIISLTIVGIASVAFLILLQEGIKRTGAFIASLFTYIGPLSAAITAVPFLGEKITFNLIIGGLLILLGVFFATTYPVLQKR